MKWMYQLFWLSDYGMEIWMFKTIPTLQIQRVWTPLWIDQSQGGGITDPVQEIIKITGAATTIEAAIAQSDHGRFWISF